MKPVDFFDQLVYNETAERSRSAIQLFRYFPNSYSYFKPFPKGETHPRLLFWLS